MQFSTMLTAAAALAVSSASKLPSTVTLFVNQVTTTTTTNIGCINGYGNFTRNQQWCYPFRNFYTTGNDSTLQGYAKCTVYSGFLDCYTGGTPLGSFTQSGNYLAVDFGSGNVSPSFSINGFPNATDNVGVPVVVGSGGSYAQIVISTKATSG